MHVTMKPKGMIIEIHEAAWNKHW